MNVFDPEAAGFVRLQDFQIPGGVDVYEYRNHQAVDGRANVLRINVYLSKDGSFVTIWNGLIDPVLAEARFELPEALKDLSFQEAYCETLFRGHIERQQEAAVILGALRLNGGRHGPPQMLAGVPYELRCEPLPATVPDAKRPSDGG